MWQGVCRNWGGEDLLSLNSHESPQEERFEEEGKGGPKQRIYHSGGKYSNWGFTKDLENGSTWFHFSLLRFQPEKLEDTLRKRVSRRRCERGKQRPESMESVGHGERWGYPEQCGHTHSWPTHVPCLRRPKFPSSCLFYGYVWVTGLCLEHQAKLWLGPWLGPPPCWCSNMFTTFSMHGEDDAFSRRTVHSLSPRVWEPWLLLPTSTFLTGEWGVGPRSCCWIGLHVFICEIR